MELMSTYKKLEISNEFKDWKGKNINSFFSYAFIILGDNVKESWQLGFYNKKIDKITSFNIDEKKIEKQKEEEIFKKSDMKITPIELDKIKLPFEKIMKKIEEFQKKTYPKELVDKKIVILQNLQEYGTVWNVTCVTHSLKTLNIKIRSDDGKIINHGINSLMDFVRK